jgi:hypothetical protein
MRQVFHREDTTSAYFLITGDFAILRFYFTLKWLNERYGDLSPAWQADEIIPWMFETLERSEQEVARRWPLLMYGTYSIAGLVFFVLGVRRHGFSQPFSLTIAAGMVVLSLFWFVTTLRTHSPLTSRRFGIHNIILLLLLMAHDIPSL